MSVESNNAAPRLARLLLPDYQLNPALLERLCTPALVIYEQRVKRNIQAVLGLMDGDVTRWRPHLKTVKAAHLFALLVKAGLRQFKCATVREAKTLFTVLREHNVNAADLLIAYPLLGPSLMQAQRLNEAFPNYTLSVLSEMTEHAASVPQGLGVFVDVNPGMNRTGIAVTDYHRIKAIAHAAGTRFRGIHFYDGHIHGASTATRHAQAWPLYQQLGDIVSALHANHIVVDEVITSGTPSFLSALAFKGFADGRLTGAPDTTHRVSPGTVVLHDFQYDQLLADLSLEPAAVILSRVISHPSEDRITCDAGSKSLACEAGDPAAFVVGHPHLKAQTASEEHLPLALTNPTAATPARGTLLYLVPKHICPTVNLAEQALCIGTDGQSRVIDITARAHDLLIDD